MIRHLFFARHMTNPIDQQAPWAGLYPKGMEGKLQLRNSHVLSAFRAAVAAHPRRAAVHYFDHTSTLKDLDESSDALACWFLHNRIKMGDRICVIAQNIPAFAISALGIWKVGAIPVPANPMYGVEELRRIFVDAAPSAVICQDCEYITVSAALQRSGFTSIPILVSAISEGAESSQFLPKAVETVGLSLTDAIASHRERRPPEIELCNQSTGLILYTSGTTGEPKGAMLSHEALAYNAQFLRDWCDLDESGKMLAIAPFFHITGFVCNLCVTLVGGPAMVINYRFEAEQVLAMIRMWKPNFMIGAITAFNALMRAPSVTSADFTCFRAVFSGGAPVPPALKNEIDAALGIEVHPCYGMTETAAPAIFTPLGVTPPTLGDCLAVGIPIPGLHVRIAAEDGSALPPGEPGEVLMCGPPVMQGYWNKPSDTADALRDGWLHSGDIGVMDDTGWVFIVDRKKDVIIASGFKVWPREVEDVLYSFPGVREAAVIGVPDDYRGETVKAYVSAVDGVTIDTAELLAHCRSSLAAYKVPRQVEVLAELPKTVSGKIQRAALRER
jgi:long-chain acyl-CoA synthetase